jgi:hypothetical protein
MHNVSAQATAIMAAFGKAGTYRRVTYRSVVKTAAAHKDRTVVKVSEFTCRAGVEYANLGVNEGRETGPLGSGYEWVEGHAPYLLLNRQGQEQVRVTYADHAEPRSSFTIDGAPATRQEVADMLTPAERAKFLAPKVGPKAEPEPGEVREPVVRNLKVEGILRVQNRESGDYVLSA